MPGVVRVSAGGGASGPRHLRLAAALGLAAALAPSPARAHDPGLSVLELWAGPDGISGWLGLATADVERLVAVDADEDGVLSPSELLTAGPRLEALARRALEVSIDGRAVTVSAASAEADPTGGVRLRFELPAAPGESVRVRSALLGLLPRGHREYAVVRDARGAVLAERMLGHGVDAIDFRVAAAEARSGRSGTFRRFTALGVEHIFTGYDHLAFLIGLLIAGGSLRAAARIITSFTAAHSITLALATFDVVHVPSRVVEPLIAASIVYVGVENLLRHAPARRWLVTFGFGLVHGFGFATALRDLGIGERGFDPVVRLFSFNLGVELGQLAVAGVALPLIWAMSRRPRIAARLVPAGSLAVVALGGFWLLQRTLLA